MKFDFEARQTIDIKGTLEAESEDEAWDIIEKIELGEVHFNYPPEVIDADIDVNNIDPDDVVEA